MTLASSRARATALGILATLMLLLLGSCGNCDCVDDKGTVAPLGAGGGGGPPGPTPNTNLDLRTQTQGGWGTTCRGSNPGCYRDANFATVFPTGVRLGCNPGFEASFTSSAAVRDFLPAGGPAGVLTADLVDPLTTPAGVFAAQLLAATLNVGFDLADPAFGMDAVNLRDLRIVKPGSPCLNMIVQDVLDMANRVIGGCALAGDLMPSQLSDCLATINENFVDGATNLGHLATP